MSMPNKDEIIKVAYGKVGKHKYDDHETEDWTKIARVQYIHENLKPQYEIKRTQA